MAELLKSLKDLTPKSIQVLNSIRPVANEMLVEIQRQLPKRTENLTRSYTFVKRHYSNGITIGARYSVKGGKGSHAHLVELGFKSRNGAQVAGRYTERRVFDMYKKKALDEISNNLSKAVEENWNK